MALTSLVVSHIFSLFNNSFYYLQQAQRRFCLNASQALEALQIKQRLELLTLAETCV